MTCGEVLDKLLDKLDLMNQRDQYGLCLKYMLSGEKSCKKRYKNSILYTKSSLYFSAFFFSFNIVSSLYWIFLHTITPSSSSIQPVHTLAPYSHSVSSEPCIANDSDVVGELNPNIWDRLERIYLSHKDPGSLYDTVRRRKKSE